MEMTNYGVNHYEIQRDADRRANRKNNRFLRIARKVLAVELAVILIEGMYHMGHFFRGYDSFGGESLLLLALIGGAVFWARRK